MAEREGGAQRLENVVLDVLDRIAEPVQAFLEIIGEERHAEEILFGTIDVLGARSLQRLVELLWPERPSADPG